LSTYLPQPLVLLAADLSPAGRPSRRAKNWAKSLEKRHPELKTKKVKALGWDRHKKNVFPDITRWFDIVGEALSNLELTRESVYIIDEAGVMLSKLGCVNVLVGANDVRDYRDARVQRKMMTVVGCISADGRYLKPSSV
jgi:hypothetical protein